MRHTSHYKYLFPATILLVFSSVSAEDGLEKATAKCEELYLAQSENSFEACIDLADDGVARAQKIIGDMNYFSWGKQVPQDYKEARKWYKRAATKGDVEAKFAVGNLYYEGLGTDINYDLAFRWFISASNDGDAKAMYNLANMYSKGAGVSVDDAKAFDWYLKSAQAGMPEAQYNVANRYAKGKGARANLIEAYYWYLVAEKNGISQAKKVSELVASKLNSLEISEVKSRVKSYQVKNN